MADIEDAPARAYAIVFRHDPARAGILHRHIPSIKFDHLGAHLAMDGIQRGLADGRRGRLYCGQVDFPRSDAQWLGCEIVELLTLSRTFSDGQTGRHWSSTATIKFMIPRDRL